MYCGSGIGETISINSFASCEKVNWFSKDSNSHTDVIGYLLEDYNIDPGRTGTENITTETIDNYHNILKRIGIINGAARDRGQGAFSRDRGEHKR